ncbi:hypothetical protein acdb102_17560 [Acidothermaceae bacterium B102]|nr:hypothetical protein acdb102_17560 [Acidothermaceae bacterium B102]
MSAWTVERAEQVILDMIDDQPTWEDLLKVGADSLPAGEGKSDRVYGQMRSSFEDAERRLERAGTTTRQTDGKFSRPGTRPGDPRPAEVFAVGNEILKLPWSLPDTPTQPQQRYGSRSRKVWDLFVDLNGRYRHCDVYDATKQLVREKRLKGAGQTYFRIGADAGRPTTVADSKTYKTAWPMRSRQELLQAQARERALVERYLKWLGRPPERAGVLPYDNADAKLEADIYDYERALLIEAKATIEREDVRMAVGQLVDYRRWAPCPEQVAVLLPESPAEPIHRFLADLGIGLIYPAGDVFVEKLVGST